MSGRPNQLTDYRHPVNEFVTNPTPYFRPHLLPSLILPLAGGGHQQLDFCTPGIEHHGTLGLQDHCTLGCSGLTTFKGQLV